MPISPGSHLGPYEVLSLVGAGGMGEVYRARDTRLGREVAIKVLPAHHLADEARRGRFAREARAAATLNHPNIATIHDMASADGRDFIVMEYVAGRPLSDAIRTGMRLREALRVAIAISDAVSRAHDAGIVHRDLKPANVVVGSDGVVKVLDFGLAKLVEPLDMEGLSERETREAPGPSGLTGPGAITGTPGYMSPEQATGGPVDARTDIFSFGSMLYEMATGRRAFQAASTSETITKVVRDEPKAPSEVAPEVPKELERVILRCLQKAPDRRFQHMADVRVELQEVKEDLDAAGSKPAAPARRRPVGWLAPALAVGLFLAVVALLRSRPAPPLPPPRLIQLTTARGIEATPALSPDGNQVAYSGQGEAASGEPTNLDIWLKMIGGSEARRLTTDPADDTAPSWSPDGRQIAFHRRRKGESSGRIYFVSPLGGGERKLTDLPAVGRIGVYLPTEVSQVSWSPDGRWLAVARARGPDESVPEAAAIHIVPIAGGEPRPITAPKPPAYDRDPAFSPDGRRIAYATCDGLSFPACDVHVLELGHDSSPTGPARRLASENVAIVGLAWSRDGRSVIFSAQRARNVQLWRIWVDDDRPPELIELARPDALSPASVPSQDRLVFAQYVSEPDIYRFEPGRPAVALGSSSASDYNPAISPDGRRIAFQSSRSGEVHQIWLTDADGSNPLQLTHGPGVFQGSPDWSPDGRRIAFDSRGEDGRAQIWSIEAEGSGLRRVTSDHFYDARPTWSRDGRWIYFRQDRADGRDLWRVPAAGGPAERLTFGGGFRGFESADGRTLFFVRQPQTSPLLAKPLRGGPDRQLADCVESSGVAVASDVYYVGCSAGRPEAPLYRLDPSTGRSHLLGKVEKAPDDRLFGLDVSADGKTILFAKMATAGADLMMIENFR